MPPDYPFKPRRRNPWKRFAWRRRHSRTPKSALRPASIFRIGLLALAVLAVMSTLRFVAEVHALRDHRSAGPEWAFPSRVYSDILAFTPGRPLPKDYLQAHLAFRGYRVAPAPLTRPGTYALLPDGVELFTRGIRDFDDPLGIRGPERVRMAIEAGRVTRIERLGGLNGIPLPDTSHAPRLEPVSVATYSDDHDVRRAWVPLTSVPRVLRDAVIASEDRRFYHHFGVDFRSNVRAMVTNMKARGVRQGASTITQQLARGLFLTKERSVFRKVREIFIAIGLEMLLSKDEILEMYMNSIYLGQEEAGGVAGVGEAARRYFDAPVETLELGQAAMLVGLIPAPNLFSPFRNPELAREKRDLVLGAMVEVGYITADEATLERSRPLEVIAGKPKPGRFPDFTGYVREYLRTRLPAGAPEHSGLSIYTTLDPVWQQDAEEWLPRSLGELTGPGKSDSLEGAYVALDPSNGAVRAMVGGRRSQPGGFNRAFQALRQPGSVIKPVVYAAALDPGRGGDHFDGASTLSDQIREFATPQGPWKPQNDENEYHEQVTVAKALAKSLNVATTNLVDSIGPRVVKRYAERFGLRGLKAVPSIGLGTSEVTLLAITNAYATFPNRGMRSEASPLRAVLGPNGRPFRPVSVRSARVIPEATAALMTGLLEDVVTFGISYPLKKHYGFTRPVAGKTGTTNDYYDAWFVGFTPDVVAGVWVGYDKPRTLGAPAAEMALPVWAKTTGRLLQGFPPTEFESDRDLEQAWIDPWNGRLSGPLCPTRMRVPFLPGALPHDSCGLDHAAEWLARSNKHVADSLAALARRMGTPVIVDSATTSMQP
jgi:penicillin-binding protein 1B